MLRNATSVATLDLVDIYFTTEDPYRTIAPIPLEIHHPNVVYVDCTVYVLGGIAGNNTWVAVTDCFEYPTKAVTEDSSVVLRGMQWSAIIIGLYNARRLLF